MGKLITSALDFIVKAIDAVPFLKNYRTAIILGVLLVLFILDKAGVGPGNMYETAAPYALPIVTATALAHDNITSLKR